MTHVLCPSCRVRFSPATTIHLEACPLCGEPIQRVVGAQHAVGYPLFKQSDLLAVQAELRDDLRVAVAVAMPHPPLRD